MQRQLQHENLLPLLGAYIHDMQLWTVTPLMAYGLKLLILTLW